VDAWRLSDHLRVMRTFQLKRGHCGPAGPSTYHHCQPWLHLVCGCGQACGGARNTVVRRFHQNAPLVDHPAEVREWFWRACVLDRARMNRIARCSGCIYAQDDDRAEFLDELSHYSCPTSSIEHTQSRPSQCSRPVIDRDRMRS